MQKDSGITRWRDTSAIKALIGFLGISLLTFVVPVRAQAPPHMFEDVPKDHWAYSAMIELRGKGLVVGYPDGYFNGRLITRYEFAVALDRLARWIIGAPRKQAGKDAVPPPPEVETIRRLLQEFRDEMRALGGDVPNVISKLAHVALTRAPEPSRSARTGWSAASGTFDLYELDLFSWMLRRPRPDMDTALRPMGPRGGVGGVVTADDAKVLGQVLEHLLKDKEFDCATGSVPAWQVQVVLDSKTLTRKDFVFLPSDDIGAGFVNRKETMVIPKDVGADLRRRNASSWSLWLGFTPRNHRVIVRDLDKLPAPKNPLSLMETFNETYPRAKGYVQVWLPGYSADGKTAVVRLEVGPTPHGSRGTYLLRKERGRWRVVSHRLHFFV